LLDIFVDADACPVKTEIYRVARRYGLKVTLVANSEMRVPNKGNTEMVVVNERLDAADDWIAEHAEKNDIVISGDIPLASRCLKKSAKVLSPKGRIFTKKNIGDSLATREILSHLRELGNMSGGPPPFQKRDRSRFLQVLDETIQSILREVDQDRHLL